MKIGRFLWSTIRSYDRRSYLSPTILRRIPILTTLITRFLIKIFFYKKKRKVKDKEFPPWRHLKTSWPERRSCTFKSGIQYKDRDHVFSPKLSPSLPLLLSSKAHDSSNLSLFLWLEFEIVSYFSIKAFV